MQRQVSTDEIERELRATLSARREIGPAYEDHLIEAFMQKLNQQALLPHPVQPQPTRGPSEGQRLALAIVSLALLIPLILLGFLFYLSLHGGGTPFFVFLAMICLTVLGVNYLFNKRR
jgi:hypothetical protein